MAHLQLAVGAAIHILSVLVTHVPTSSMIAAVVDTLAAPMSQMFKASMNKSVGVTAKIYTTQVLQKVRGGGGRHGIWNPIRDHIYSTVLPVLVPTLNRGRPRYYGHKSLLLLLLMDLLFPLTKGHL